MHLYIDFDGVLANTGVVKRRWLEANIGGRFDLSLDRTTLEPAIGRDAYLAMQAQVGFADTLDAPPMRGASAVVSYSKTMVVPGMPPFDTT